MGHEGDLTFSLCTPRTPRLVDVGHDLLTMGECVCVRERERERKRERKREKEKERKRENDVYTYEHTGDTVGIGRYLFA